MSETAVFYEPVFTNMRWVKGRWGAFSGHHERDGEVGACSECGALVVTAPPTEVLVEVTADRHTAWHREIASR